MAVETDLADEIHWDEDDDTGSDIGSRWRGIQAAANQKFEISADEKKEILKARAKSLARSEADSENQTDYLEVLEFTLSGERYAIENCHVREVVALREITPLPCTPAYIAGIVNVRGEILAVVNLKRFFDLSETDADGNRTRLIIIESDEMELCILADDIAGVKSVPLASIQASLPTLDGIRADYSKGVTADRMAILDGQQILADKMLIVNEPVSESEV